MAEPSTGGSEQLAELFIELVAKGADQLGADLDQIRGKAEQTEKALGAPGFRTAFMEKLGLSRQLLDSQVKVLDQVKQLYDTGPYQRYVREHVRLSQELAGGESKAARIRAEATRDFTASLQGRRVLGQKVADQERAKAATKENETLLLGERVRFLRGTEGQKVQTDQLRQGEIGSLLQKQQQLQEMQVRVRWYGLDEGRRFLKEQQLIQKELGKLQATEDWRRLVAEQGRFGAGLTKIQDGLQGFTTKAAIGFASLTAAITGAVAAASPETFQTFTGSIQLVTAAVGQMFVPAMADLSRKIQDVYRWIRSLDPETKQQIVTWTLYGAAALGAALVLPKIIGLVAMLRTGLFALDAALLRSVAAARTFSLANVAGSVSLTTFTAAVVKATAALRAFALAHPVTAALAFAGAIWGLSAAFGSAADNIESVLSRTGQLESRIHRLRQGGRPTMADVREHLPPELIERLEANPKEPRRREVDVQTFIQNRQRELDRIPEPERVRREVETALRAREGQFGLGMPTSAHRYADLQRILGQFGARAQDIGERHGPLGGTLGGRGWFGMQGLGEDRVREIANNAAELARNRRAQAQAGIETARGAARHGVRPDNAGQQDLLISSNFQAQFTSIEQGWRRIQQAAASGGTLEQEQMRIHRESLNALVGPLEQIEVNTRGDRKPPRGQN